MVWLSNSNSSRLSYTICSSSTSYKASGDMKDWLKSGTALKETLHWYKLHHSNLPILDWSHYTQHSHTSCSSEKKETTNLKFHIQFYSFWKISTELWSVFTITANVFCLQSFFCRYHSFSYTLCTEFHLQPTLSLVTRTKYCHAFLYISFNDMIKR